MSLENNTFVDVIAKTKKRILEIKLEFYLLERAPHLEFTDNKPDTHHIMLVSDEDRLVMIDVRANEINQLINTLETLIPGNTFCEEQNIPMADGKVDLS